MYRDFPAVSVKEIRKEDALQNIREATRLYLEPIEDDAVFSETATP